MADTRPFPHSENIHVLTVPLPGFPDLICSNMYVLGKGPVTLIDAAPKFPGSFLAMERQLSDAGFTWKEVERIIITHGHIDHFGLVGQIRHAASRDIPCHVHADDLWRLSSEYLRSGMWSRDADSFAARAGIPAVTVERMKRRSHFFKNLCDPVDNALSMEEGDTFEGKGFELSVIHTPGHSPGCCCIYERHSRILFSGDHLLKHITPNPFHEVNRSRLRSPEYRSLKAYLASLDKLEHLDMSFAFPGHGDSIDDVKGLMEGYRRHHQERVESVQRALEGRSRSLHELMTDLFPGLVEAETFLAISEVLVHLELLEEDGKARLLDEGPPARYGCT
jgi:glyoxylase-like metal-dependent hydrolase (beta-lactamase superfamily II)